MFFRHADHPERGVRLAYCLNLHGAEELEGAIGGIRQITLPLAERLGGADGFGLGSYLPWRAVEHNRPDGDYAAFLATSGLDPFTWNAFPFGGFHKAGLKEGVFRPTWADAERVEFTRRIARFAAESWRTCGEASRHVSVSTHTGMHSSDRGVAPEACVANFVATAAFLAELEDETGCRVVLSLEPEPRSSANDTAELVELHRRIRAAGAPARHVGTCLDACHAAVEFEHPQDAYLNATADGTPLGKLQFSSAITLRDPARNDAARTRLFALDEPVYLHQVTGRHPGGTVRADDLGDALVRFDRSAPGWRDCDEWRCHFHVPVDLGAVGEGPAGLGTTRAYADELLRLALADPERWGTDELHVEIETYTWDVLPGEARGDGGLIDGLEREYAHVLDVLSSAGWTRKQPPGTR